MTNLTALRIWVNKRLVNIPGWKTSEKLIVIESDDWGAIRMPSVEVLRKMQTCGISVDDPFSSLDSLESNDDLERLFELLSSKKDNFECNPIISANCVVANPDFQRIQESDYTQYFFELITETFRRYPNHDKSFKLWKKGLENNIFFPQYHGREHLNVAQWMDQLKKGNRDYKVAFSFNTYSINSKEAGEKRNNLLAALDYNSAAQKQRVNESVVEGLEIFESLLGIKSDAFTPPCNVWGSDTEELLSMKGVKHIKSSKTQNIPKPGYMNYSRGYHYIGQRNKFGQHYQIRNCLFEPALNPKVDWVDACMKSIEVAFSWHKPAIISCHRLNFIGSLNHANRRDNLILFDRLLTGIIKKWPDVRFVDSATLGEKIMSCK